LWFVCAPRESFLGREGAELRRLDESRARAVTTNQRCMPEGTEELRMDGEIESTRELGKYAVCVCVCVCVMPACLSVRVDGTENERRNLGVGAARQGGSGE